jgi:hypothetical protein
LTRRVIHLRQSSEPWRVKARSTAVDEQEL